MTDDENRRRLRELLGARLLGDIEPEENAELDNLLERFPELRREEAELRAVANLLGEPGSRRDENPEPPPGLREKVVEEVFRGGDRRRMKAPLAAAAAVAAVVLVGVVAVLVAGLPNSGGVPGLGDEEPISFASVPQGVTVSDASVVAHTWGTEVFIKVAGLEDGEVYTIEVESEDGSSESAGTMIGVGENEIDCALNAAILRQNAESITISDSSGGVVLRSDLEDRPPSLYT